LEFAIQEWNPYYKKDIKELEKVQRRTTKMIPELRHLEYAKKIGKSITTLEVRRERGDLIHEFKIYKGIDRMNMKQVPSIRSSELGPATNIRVAKHRIKSELAKSCKTRQYFF
jgi:hypothetical protein